MADEQNTAKACRACEQAVVRVTRAPSVLPAKWMIGSNWAVKASAAVRSAAVKVRTMSVPLRGKLSQ